MLWLHYEVASLDPAPLRNQLKPQKMQPWAPVDLHLGGMPLQRGPEQVLQAAQVEAAVVAVVMQAATAAVLVLQAPAVVCRVWLHRLHLPLQWVQVAPSPSQAVSPLQMKVKENVCACASQWGMGCKLRRLSESSKDPLEKVA